jgi:hypothetical protein
MPSLITEQTILGDILHSWSFPEFEKYARPRLWYIIFGTLGVVLLLVALLSQNFLFALILVLFGVIVYMQEKQSPQDIPFGISTTGVLLGSRHYTHAEFDSFYIVYQPPEVKTLYLITKNPTRPRLSIPLVDTDPVSVRETLKQFLSENMEEDKEAISDTFGRNWMLG